MSNLKIKLWVEKYKPTTFEDYIFQNSSNKKAILSTIDNNLPGHILLSGVQGSGKTTLSNLIISKLNVDPSDVLIINASDETQVDVIRNKITTFISAVPNGDFRVVQIEEADYLSKNAQAALRIVLEEYVDYAKFIFTCNYVHKIIPALKSRMHIQLDFKAPDKIAITKKIIQILLAENVKFEPAILSKYIDISYPDFRKIIQTVQQNSINEVLLDPLEENDNDYKFKILDLLEQGDWSNIRKIICEQVSNDEIDDVYRFIYENLDKSKNFKNIDNWQAGIVLIADYLYKDSLVSDREINIAALFIELGKIQDND